MGTIYLRAEAELREKLRAQSQQLEVNSGASSRHFPEKSLKRSSQTMSLLSHAGLHLEASQSQGGLFSRSWDVTDEMQSNTATESSNGTPDLDYHPAGKAQRRSKPSLASHVLSSIGWLCRPNTQVTPKISRQGTALPQERKPTTSSSYALPATRTGTASAATTTLRTRPIPVRRSRHSAATRYEDDNNEQNIENLKRIYDMRTWDMYVRITESRKQSSYSPQGNNNTNTAASHLHPLDVERDVVDPHAMESDDHELIFGDLD